MSKSKLSKEEELLLQGFSSNISKKDHVMFYIIAVLITSVPIYLYYGVYQMEPVDSWIIWLLSVVGASGLLGTAYRNTKQMYKHAAVVKRGEAVAREVSKTLSSDKKISSFERDERILFKKNEVGDYEATTLSIFYNNVLFMALFLVISFFILYNINPVWNCLGSLVGSAGLVALFSTSK
uniref:Translocon-associated protein subunit gamma n=1 Tax=Panagrolaimus sp. JU765 TaxID=591449 RepID=A0AC34QK94_9BILA